MRVPAFEAAGWTCEWDARKGTHTFRRDRELVVVRSNGAYLPGGRPLAVKDSIVPAWRRPPYFASVERNLLRRALPYKLRAPAGDDPTKDQSIYDRPLVGTPGSNEDGAQVSGAGIELSPTWRATTLQELDAQIERHPCALFHAETGEPLTRALLGYGDEYLLDQAEWWAAPPQRFAQVASGALGIPTPYDSWKRYAGSHLVRAFGPAIAAWNYREDPGALWLFNVLAHHAVLSFATQPVGPNDGYFRLSLATMNANVRANPHKAKLGVVRWLAHCARVVIEAQKAKPSRLFESWIRLFVDTMWLGQGESGTFGDNTIDEASAEQGQPWKIPQSKLDGSTFRLLDPSEGEVPSWQLTFLVRTLWEAQKAIPELRAKVIECLRRYARIWQTCPLVPDRYHPERQGLPYWLVTSRGGVLLPSITEGIGLADTSYDDNARECLREAGVAA